VLGGRGVSSEDVGYGALRAYMVIDPPCVDLNDCNFGDTSSARYLSPIGVSHGYCFFPSTPAGSRALLGPAAGSP
jgi:hypothetical protein